jgi:hypothetical protein
MFEAVRNFFTGLTWSSLILLVLAAWYVARHGLPAALGAAGALGGRIAALWNAGVSDVKAVQTALAGDVAILKNDVEAIKQHLGLAAPPAPPAAPSHGA